MVDNTETKPIEVAANAGLIDGAQAAIRYIAFLFTAATALLGLIKTRDIAGAIAYIQANGGDMLSAISGLTALAIAAYGVFKTRKRGAQLVTVAADRRVPNAVASLK